MTSGALAKAFVAALASACIAFGASQGFAASFGPAMRGFGATSTVVGACGTGLRLGYATAFDPGIPGYAIDRIDVSNIPAGCLGKNLVATFYGPGDTAVGSAVDVTLPASGTTESIAVDPSSNTIDAGEISGVSVVLA